MTDFFFQSHSPFTLFLYISLCMGMCISMCVEGADYFLFGFVFLAGD